MKKQYYIECIAIENQVKVTAVDPETGTEATVICPINATRQDRMDLAVRKLEYMLRKAEHE